MGSLNWKDHIINLFVVIIGISVAFYLEGYRVERQEAKLEKLYIENLKEDLNTDLKLIDTLGHINKRLNKALIRLTEVSTGSEVPSDSLMYYMFSILYNPPFDPQNTTYESMKNSGQLSLISKFEVRTKLTKLYEKSYGLVETYDKALDENLRDFIKPYHTKNAIIRSGNDLDPAYMRTSEFRNMIFGYRYLYRDKSAVYERVKIAIQDMLDTLESIE